MGSAASKRRGARDGDWLLQTLDEHESAINCMAISHDHSVLATGSDDHTIRLWSAKTPQVECLSVLVGHADYITHILIEENFLISASADRTMRKWDMTNGECLLIFSGHSSLINRMVFVGKLIIVNCFFWKFFISKLLSALHFLGLITYFFPSSRKKNKLIFEKVFFLQLLEWIVSLWLCWWNLSYRAMKKFVCFSF